MAFITIDYHESDKETIPCNDCEFCKDEVCETCNNTGRMPAIVYEKIELSSSHADPKIKKIFESGNFVKDWLEAIKYWLFELKDPYLSKSSSIDHFIMDGAPYDSAYLKELDDEGFLDYNYDYNDPGIEMFVPENTKPTWKELKEMCK